MKPVNYIFHEKKGQVIFHAISHQKFHDFNGSKSVYWHFWKSVYWHFWAELSASIDGLESYLELWQVGSGLRH